MRFDLVVDGEPHEIEVRGRGARLRVVVDGVPYLARPRRDGESIVVTLGPTRHRVRIVGSRAFVDGVAFDISARAAQGEPASAREDAVAASRRLVEIRPPMPGRIVRVAVSAGARVRRGETLVVLEAMKMQNEIAAPFDARVRDIRVREGDSIPGDRVIAVLEAS